MNIKNMDFYYLREHRKVDVLDTNGNSLVLDFTSLTLFERLILSAVLTYLKQGGTGVSGKVKPSHIVNIVYGVDDAALLTTGQLTAFSKLATDTIVNKAHMIAWLIDNIGKKTKDDHGNEKDFIKCITINSRQIFATRNGKDCKSLDSIAWRAAALNAATAKNKLIYDFQSLSIFNWLNSKVISITDLLDSASEDEYEQVRYNFVHNKGNMKKAIQNWLDAVGIDGEFDRNSCIIKGFKECQKKEKTTLKAETSNHNSEPKKLFDSIEQQKKPKAEPVEPVKEAEEEECKGVDKGFNNYCKARGMTPELEIDMTSTKTTYPKNSVQWKIQNILNMDPVKFQNLREKLSSSADKKGKTMIYDNVLVKIYNKLSAIAKKYKIANRDDIKDHFTKGSYLKLPDYACFIEDLKAMRNWAMPLLSDDEDSRILEDDNLRKLARLDFVKSFGWLMNIQ